MAPPALPHPAHPAHPALPPALPPAIAAVLPPALPVRSATLLASLWSNYGHIYRLTLSRAPGTLILKLIQPPPPTSSTSASESHLRKLISYRVERYFYAHLAAQLSSRARVARAYPVAAQSALLLEDLAPAFPLSSSSGDPHIVLRWLANFHAAFWGARPAVVSVSSSSSSSSAGVWSDGGYWYLATRRGEFAAAAARNDPDGVFLRGFATYAARRVACREGPGTTLVHGDCKGANVAWARGGGGCALYDFQYVGRGLGVQDVVYFLATSVARARLQEGEGGEEAGGAGGEGGECGPGKGEEALWRVYYAELEAALARRGLRIADEGYTWAVMLEQADCALVDWMRFMVGWGRWGNAQWVEGRARAICRRWGEEGKGEEEEEEEGEEGEGESE